MSKTQQLTLGVVTKLTVEEGYNGKGNAVGRGGMGQPEAGWHHITEEQECKGVCLPPSWDEMKQGMVVTMTNI